MIVIPLSGLSAVDAARRLACLPLSSFLDSAAAAAPAAGLDRGASFAGTARYSFVAADPFAVLDVGRDGAVFWNGAPLTLAAGDGRSPGRRALDFVKDRLAAFAHPGEDGLPPFQGGAAGYIAYEFGSLLERLPPAAVAEDGAVRALRLHFYDVVIAFDHLEERAVLMSTGDPAPDGPSRRARARTRADFFLRRLGKAPPPLPAGAGTAALDWTTSLDGPAFEAAVRRTIGYIRDGDIFQANIARRLEAVLPVGFDAWAYYLRLRQRNPAPFSAWLDCGPLKIASSSPERFVSIAGDRLAAHPIKGTAPRENDPAADRAAAEALAASEKDIAENVMIVDLLRSDLSRVCRPHTVDVPQLCAVESFAGLHHLVSVVTGRLEPGLGASDVLAAAFPGGSITGAPKLRAMEIIAALEGVERGVYCGSLGYFGFEGAADFNIAIRTASFAGGRVRLGAGGGITLLSDPAAERREAELKASRVVAAFSPDGSGAPP